MTVTTRAAADTARPLGTKPSTVEAAAYRHCWQIASRHYENFTVGSWLLPRRLRHHIAAIYAFARTADDMADEGAIEAAERLARLTAWEDSLEHCYRGECNDPVFIALARTIAEYDLPIDPFRKLLMAFRTDAQFHGFATFDELLEYCRHSANPVGHLILYLFGYRESALFTLADHICTGLQLANFWQDLAIDSAKGRLYLPLEDLSEFRCSPTGVTDRILTADVRRLLAFEVTRARNLLLSGLELVTRVNQQLAREVRLFAWGGLAILHKIDAVDYDVFTRRPTLSKLEKTVLILRSLTTAATPGSLQAPLTSQPDTRVGTCDT